MRTIFASVYSGIGGADAGFCTAGWAVRWQCEVDPYRRALLEQWFRVPVFHDINALAAQRHIPSVDVLYGELPDHRIDRWWPAMHAISQKVRPLWLICEMSPTVRCDSVLRDVIADGLAFRLVHIRCIVDCKGVPKLETDVRNRALVLACRDPEPVDAMKFAGNYAELVTNGDDVTGIERLSIPWYEESRGFRAGWTCICRQTPCTCNEQQQVQALSDATSPHLTRWLAQVIEGEWTDGIVRGLTEADGGKTNVGRVQV